MRKLIAPIQRIPEWLLEEKHFVITCDPITRPSISVRLDEVFNGHGFSVAEAAKSARKKRDASVVPQ